MNCTQQAQVSSEYRSRSDIKALGTAIVRTVTSTIE